MNDIKKRLGQSIIGVPTNSYLLAKDALAEIERLESLIVWGFYEDERPKYFQGNIGIHELSSPITAEEANGLVSTIVELSEDL